METDAPHTDPARPHWPDGSIRVWRVIGQSFSVLFRNIVPFLVLAWGADFVIHAAFNGLLKVSDAVPTGLLLWSKVGLSLLLGGLSQVALEAVIAMAVWLDLGGRRLTLKGSLISAGRAIPEILHRPFYVFVTTVLTIALLRAALTLPYHVAKILIIVSELPVFRMAALLAAAGILGGLVDILIDSRLLILIPTAAIERTRVVHGFRRCWRLTSRHWTRTLGLVLLLAALDAAPGFSRGLLAGWMGATPGDKTLRSLLALARTVTRILVRVYKAIVAAACYRHIRIADGEIASEQTALPATG